MRSVIANNVLQLKKEMFMVQMKTFQDSFESEF